MRERCRDINFKTNILEKEDGQNDTHGMSLNFFKNYGHWPNATLELFKIKICVFVRQISLSRFDFDRDNFM